MPKTLDPSRTTTLRRQFMADMMRRIKALKRQIRLFLVDQDAFGLTPIPAPGPFKLNRKYAFKTDAEKLGLFREWLQGQVDQGILETTELGKPWTNTYIDSSYRKGVARAYTDTNKEALAPSDDFFAGSKAQFLQQAFAAPETVSKIQLLATRSFNELKGFTDQMGADANRILANGIANGNHSSKIAREMSTRIDGLTKKRALVIARTEVIHAHAEGQLDSFERLGVEEVGIKAEWATAGDDRVCENCGALEGTVMTVQEARGLIPLHPNCRCSYLPAVDTKKSRLTDKKRDALEMKLRPPPKTKAKAKAKPRPRRESVADVPEPDDVPDDAKAKFKKLNSKSDREFEKAASLDVDDTELNKHRRKFGKQYDNRSNMTQSQRESLEEYTGYDFARINGMMRKTLPDFENLPQSFFDETQNQIDNIRGAIQNAPVMKKDTAVFRGLPRKVIDDKVQASGGDLIGTVIQDDAFVSVTASRDVAKAFAGHPEHAYIIEGTIPKGAKYIRGLDKEFELILPPGTRMEIVGQREWSDVGPHLTTKRVVLEVLFHGPA